MTLILQSQMLGTSCGYDHLKVSGCTVGAHISILQKISYL